jgi:endonuclease/exonuclease/phosphatase (EEP) superfamily protein YafD
MVKFLTTILGLGALVVAAVALGVRWVPITATPVLIAAAAAPYLAVAAPAAVLLLLAGRRWLLSVVALLLTAGLVLVYLPRYQGAAPTGAAAAVDVRVLTTNLGMGQADPSAFVALARAGADVVAVQEMTPQAADGLVRAGIDAAFPHRVAVPAALASGIGIWSRFPLADAGRIEGYALPLIGARVRIPGVRVDATVLAVHLAAPWPQPIRFWRSDVARFPDTLRETAQQAGAGAVIVAGDLNTTADMAPFRALLAAGYADAAAQAGAGLARSYPAQQVWPPLLGIDHVLLRNAAAATARTVAVAGADHLGLLATVRVPVDSAAS